MSEHDNSGRIQREVERLLGPGPAKVQPPRDHERSMLRAKERFAAIVDRLGLSHRETARRLRVDESTLRGWLDIRDLRRNPPQWAIDELGREAHEAAAYAHARAAANDTDPQTGTLG